MDFYADLHVMENCVARKNDRNLTIWIVFAIGLFQIRCSSGEKRELAALPPAPPGYLSVKHPTSYNIGDIESLFSDISAPRPESLENCLHDVKRLTEATPSQNEIYLGIRELIREEPEEMHWCFYAQIILVEKDLKEMKFLDDRQKRVLNAYPLLAPIARVFWREYDETRYFRTLVVQYKKISEWVFFRELEPTPQLTSALAGSPDTLGKTYEDEQIAISVLEKYKIRDSKEPALAPKSNPPEEAPFDPVEADDDGLTEIDEIIPSDQKKSETKTKESQSSDGDEELDDF